MEPARFLLVSHDAGGTVPPMIALAGALRRRGYHVTLLGQPSIEHRATAAGCRFVPFATVPDYDPGRAIEEQLEVVAEVLVGASPGEDVRAVAGADGVDAVVVDGNVAGAAAAAEALPCPSAILLHSLYATYVDTWFGELWPLLEPGVNDTRARYGLAPARSWGEAFSGHGRILSVVPKAFDVPGYDVPGSLRHTGFLVPGAPEANGRPPELPDGDGPVVLVSLSTTYQGQEDLLQRALDAVGRCRVRALVTTGRQFDPADLRAPANAVLARYVPHPLVLPRVDAVVTHGGLGTVAGALAHGLPLVCVPIGRDQPLNAERVAAVGAGIGLAPDADPAAIAGALDAVLDEPRYRAAARDMAAASAAAGGPVGAARELEALLTASGR